MASPARSWVRGAVLAALLTGTFCVSHARADEAYAPRPEDDIRTLLEIVRHRSPALQSELLAADIARADAHQARLLGNPVLDATWGTIPVGKTNPANLDSPLTNVPNYSIGASYTFPLGKRGPRQERGNALAEAASHAAETSVRNAAIEFARVLGRLAVTRLRIDGVRNLVVQQQGVLDIARTRLQQGFATPLELDRLEIDLNRYEQQVLVNETTEKADLTTCALYAGKSCRPVASAEDARALILAWTKRAHGDTPPLEQRPDFRALAAYQKAAIAETALSRAQVIPDPTVRLGYMYDQFQISGNQVHSLNVTLTLPVTVFDRGQAQIEAAEARRTRIELQRSLLRTSSQNRITALRELLRLQEARQEAITKTLPRVRAMLEDLQRAANGRLVPLTDVLQARRTLDELLVEEADSYGDTFQTSIDLIAETGSVSK